MIVMPAVGIFSTESCKIWSCTFTSPLKWMIVHAFGRQREVAVTLDLIAQQRARAGAPRAAIGFADITVDKVQRWRIGVRAVADSDAAAQIGNQPQVAIREGG